MKNPVNSPCREFGASSRRSFLKRRTSDSLEGVVSYLDLHAAQHLDLRHPSPVDEDTVAGLPVGNDPVPASLEDDRVFS